MSRLPRRSRASRQPRPGPARATAERLEPRRLLTAGQLDGTFGNGGTVATTFSQAGYGAVDAALQPDGKILAVGAAVPGYELRDGFQLLRYTPDGSLDPSFGVAGRAPAPPTMAGWTPMDMALAPDGDILISGAFVHIRLGQPDQDFVVTRFHADGSLDTAFGTNGVLLRDWGEFSRAYAVAVQPDGKILAAGWTTWSGDQLSVLRFNADGTTDTSFGNGGIAQVEPSGLGWPASTYAMALAPDGKIVVGGYASDPARNSGAAVARFNADGSLDTSFNGTGSVILADVPHEVQELHVYDDGRVLMAGEELLARRLANGQPDPTFSPNGRRPGLSGSAMGMDVGTDGTILATSFFDNFTTFRFSDGGTWLDYVTTQIPGGTTATWDRATAVVIQPDSKFVAVGNANGGTSFGLARYQGTQSAPEVAHAEFVLSPRAEIRFAFSEPVFGLDLDDLQVINAATGTRVNPSQFFMNASSTGSGFNNATWIPVSPLPGGNYRAVLPAGSVSNGNGIAIARFELPFTVPGGDVTPPLVNRYFYVDSPSQEIHFEFTEDVLDSLDLDDLVVTDRATGQRVAVGSFFLNARGGPNFPTEAVWVPAGGLPAGNYHATLPAGSVADPAGNGLPEDVQFDFTAGDPAPYVTSASFTIAPDGINKEVVVNFSEGMDETSVRSAPFRIYDRATGTAVPGIALRQWNGGTGGTTRAHWGGAYVLPAGNYHAVLPADGVRSLTGQPMARDFTYDFSVGPQPDNTPPGLSRPPEYMDWPVPQQRLQFEFNEDIVSGVDRDAIRLVNLDTGQTLPAAALVGGPWTLTATQWTAAQPLPAAHYRAIVPAGSVRDRYGNGLRDDVVLDFEVTGPGDRTPPTVASARWQPRQSPGQSGYLRVDYSENVFDSVDGSDLVVTDLTTGRVLPPYRFYGSASGGPFIPTQAGYGAIPELPFGRYRATILAGSVSDPSGNALAKDYTFEFDVPNDDTTGPYILTRAFVRGDRPYVEYTFSEDVTQSVGAADLVLLNQTTGQQFGGANALAMEVIESPQFPTVARWYPTAPLPPGRYVASLAPGGVTDRSGNEAQTGTQGLTFFVSGVVGRRLFYNNSAYDAQTPGADPADDGAIAPDKQALLPGQTASFANVSSYARGINGVMIDIAGLPGGTTLRAQDLLVLPPGVAAPEISVRPGAGVGGSDRVTLVFADGTARNRWLTLGLLANAVTGLASGESFSFGNLVGETGDPASRLRVSAFDVVGVQRTLNSASTLVGRFDFDRDGRVTARDLTAARRNMTVSLARPPAPTSPAGSVAVPATDLLRSES